MDDRDELDPGVVVEVALDVGRVDGVVVGDLQLVQLGAEILQPVAHPLAEDSLDEVEHLRPRLHQPARRRLESQYRLALHEQDVVLRQEDLGELAFGRPEALDERGVVVVDDRRAERGENARASR